jgi:hypothetical protein
MLLRGPGRGRIRIRSLFVEVLATLNFAYNPGQKSIQAAVFHRWAIVDPYVYLSGDKMRRGHCSHLVVQP